MRTEFKVMPWLRELRDRNAKDEAGLSIEERLRRSREKAAGLLREFRLNHPEASKKNSPPQALVAEDGDQYGGSQRRRP
jgi:hypothetical protein